MDLDPIKNPYTLIKSLYPDLHKVEKKIADFILSDGDRISTMTVAACAAAIEVAESSIIRFCKILGYDGFTALKVNLARYSLSENTPIFEDISKEDDLCSIATKVFSGSIRCLQDTMNIFNFQSFEAAVQILDCAEQIVFFGVGSSASIANDSYYRFMRIGFPAIACTDSHISKITASLLDEHCVAVAISHTGRTKETWENIKIAKEHGAKTICITSFPKSPIASLSDIVLSISSRETELFNEAISSRIAHIALLDSLYTALSIKHFSTSMEHIDNMNHILTSSRL